MHRRKPSIAIGLTLAYLVAVAFAASTVVAVPVQRATRVVPDAPTVHVANEADASATAASLTAWARATARGVAPRIPVDSTGFAFLSLNDVNGWGTVVGYGAESSYKSASRDLVLVRDGNLTDIGRTGAPEPLGDRSAFAEAINDDEVVTGVAPCQCNRVPAGVPASIAFRWSAADGFSFAPMPAGVVASTGVDINDNGVILVNSWASPDPADDGAWLWDPNRGTLVKLGDLGTGAPTGTSLNNDGTAVGYAPVGDVNHAVRWGWGRAHRITDLAPGATASKATDIDEDGTIVGWRGSHAVAWLANGRRTRDLGEGKALAINDNDQVAGNVVLAHVVPDDGGVPVDATVAAVYDLWAPKHRVVLDTPRLLDFAPTRLNDDGLVVNDQSLYGPADPS